MNKYTVFWTKRALRRLDQIGAEIWKSNPVASSRVISRLISATDILAEHSAIGRVGRIFSTREIVLTDIPYIIAYRILGDRIDILTILHMSQKWPDKM
jgi:toxin ParE1/3/4